MNTALLTVTCLIGFVAPTWLGEARECPTAAAGDEFHPPRLTLPVRRDDAPGASDLLPKLVGLSRRDREEQVVSQVLAGNVPDFLRTLRPVTISNVEAGKPDNAVFFAAPDYLAVGSDDDFFLMPLSPRAAQRIADDTGCLLPTRRMVDAVYAAAAIKHTPLPMKPGPEMTDVTYFWQHNHSLRHQRSALLPALPSGGLFAGHKKDVVITPRLATAPGKVAIYGWHHPASEGASAKPIQPLYLGHTDSWVDYSHGIRLIGQTCVIDKRTCGVREILADPDRCAIFSDEGPIAIPRYDDPPADNSNEKCGLRD